MAQNSKNVDRALYLFTPFIIGIFTLKAWPKVIETAKAWDGYFDTVEFNMESFVPFLALMLFVGALMGVVNNILSTRLRRGQEVEESIGRHSMYGSAKRPSRKRSYQSQRAAEKQNMMKSSMLTSEILKEENREESSKLKIDNYYG